MINDSSDDITLFFAGDICISQPLANNPISEQVADIILKHDFRIANWEAPIIDNDFERIVKAGPHIYQHAGYEYILEKNLFNIFSIANNHILDFGIKGLEKTINVLSNKKISILGAGTSFRDAYAPLILQKSGLKIALIACGESQFGCLKYPEQSYGYAWIFSEQIAKNVMTLRNEVDFIIVLPHAGLEMADIPLPEWRYCYRTLIDYGADLVIASHPHVIQPKETYKGKSIYYSLGNFLFNEKYDDDRWNKSLNLSIKISQKDKSLDVKEYFFEYKNESLFVSDEVYKFKELSAILLDDINYFNRINSICVTAWHEYYESYYHYYDKKLIYKEAFLKLPAHILSILEGIFKKFILNYGKKNQILLYHNISVDTHRFVVERALKILNGIM